MKKYMSIALLTGALLFSGCGDSTEEFVFTNTNNVIAAPVCVDDAYATNQNAVLTVNAATGVLANDVTNGGTVTAFDAVGTQGGTVAMNADGSFSYTPVANFNGNDTFTYTLANGSGQVTCTVTITVNVVNGFFVDAVNGNDGTGSFTGGLPFQTIQAAVAAAPTNADIVVLPGNYTGTVNLKDGQRLLGSGSPLVNPRELFHDTLRTRTALTAIEPDNTYFVSSKHGNDLTGHVGPTHPFATIQAAVDQAPEGADIVVESGRYTEEVRLKTAQRLLGSGSAAVRAQGSPTRPLIDGERIVLGDGNTVDFFRIINSPDDAVDGDGRNSGTICNCEIEDIANADGIALENSPGTWNVANNTIRNVGGTGFGVVATLNGAGTTGSYEIQNNEITGGDLSAIGLRSEDTSDVRASVVGNVMRGNNIVTGDALELQCVDDSTFCLDLEDNIADLDTNPGNGNDGVYSLFENPFGTSVLSVEQFAGGNLTNPQPGGAGNSGVVDDNTGIGGDLPTSVADGTCGF